MANDNYPAGVTDAHPYFNPPPEQECEECGEDVYPGQDCEHCGTYCLSEQEMADEYADQAADNQYDAMMERDEMEAYEDPYEEY